MLQLNMANVHFDDTAINCPQSNSFLDHPQFEGFKLLKNPGGLRTDYILSETRLLN